MIGKDNEGREIFILGTECVGDPGTSAGKSGEIESGRLQEGTLAVDAGLSDKVVNECEIINDLSQRSDDVTELFPTLSVGSKVPWTCKTGTGCALKQFDFLTGVPRFPVFLPEQGLVVKSVDVACGSRHEKLNDPLCLRWMMEGP